MIARQPLIVPFTKMNGSGNDFVVLDNRFLHFSAAELEALARQVCPRRTGIGADGLLAMDPPGPADDGADFRMRYRNADGSLGTMCGNGARCLARFAQRAGLGTEADGITHLAFATDAGRYAAQVTDDTVVLAVPPARAWDAEATSPLGPVRAIWTGTEHVVVLVDDVDAVPLTEEGARLRHHPAFAPTGANVDVVEVLGESDGALRVRARTFEKGVEAETLACGTGAVASALVAASGRDVEAVEVTMPGGVLRVGLGRDGLTLGGPAERVYEGTLEWWG